MQKDINKILLIKFRHHGDILLTTPLISCLRHFFPDSKIDFLLYQECEPLLKNHPDINQLFFVDRSWKKNGFFKVVKEEFLLLKKLFFSKYDLVLNLTEGDRGAFYSLFSRAKIRVGVDPRSAGFLLKSKFFTHLVNPHGLTQHTVESQIDFLRVLRMNPPYEKRELKLVYDNNDLNRIKRFSSEKTILIHGVSRWMFKAIPINLIKMTIQKLVDLGFKVLLTGSHAEVEMKYNKEVSLGFSCDQVQDLSGELTILELAALIDSVDGMITCDSLPLHISSVYKKKVLAVFGPSSATRWAPWKNPFAKVFSLGLPCQPCFRAGCQNSKESDCLTQINFEQFYRAVQETIM